MSIDNDNVVRAQITGMRDRHEDERKPLAEERSRLSALILDIDRRDTEMLLRHQGEIQPLIDKLVASHDAFWASAMETTDTAM